ncbi:glycerophosphoryl diester phosphodiesterase membrane domain-containing protein [Enterococcus sp. LJL98]
MLHMLKENWRQTLHFFKQTTIYFRDVLLIHGLLLFLLIPLLSNATRLLFKIGHIPYLAFDNLGQLISQHPLITISLLLILVSVVGFIYFEFTFLLLSLYFIKQQHPISLKNLLQLTLSQMRKLRPSVIFFFLFYFFLVLPLGGFSLHSELLSKIKFPAFIVDFIFINRLPIIVSYLLIYFLLTYLAFRLVFTLPAMVLLNYPLKRAVRESLLFTRQHFWKILFQLVFLTFGLLFLTTTSFSFILFIQRQVETFASSYALPTAVFSLFGLQAIYVLNLVLSTIVIFFSLIEWMSFGGYLLPIPETYFALDVTKKEAREQIKFRYFLPMIAVALTGVLSYNYLYLTTMPPRAVKVLSHRGVSHKNGVQNSIEALRQTSQTFQPNYVEMDIQLTSDKKFIVFHDFQFKELTGFDQIPEKSTFAQTQMLRVQENQQEARIPAFDDYLLEAKKHQQKLLVEIKTQRTDIDLVVDTFLAQYAAQILEEGHLVQSLSYSLVEKLKEASPEMTVGYIVPFNIIGPPLTKANFLTMEYSTLNRAFVNAAHLDGKKVFTWTPNKKETMERMIFYGVDGIITDRLDVFETIERQPEKMTYSDKLAYFLIGVG